VHAPFVGGHMAGAKRWIADMAVGGEQINARYANVEEWVNKVSK